MDKKTIIAVSLLILVLISGSAIFVFKPAGINAGLAGISGFFEGGRVEIKPRAVVGPQGGSSHDAPSGKTAKTAAVPKEKEEPIVLCVPDAAIPQKAVIINEIAWMGTGQSYADEWIELKNISSDTADLSKWQLRNKSGKIKVRFFEGATLSPGSFFLLERTDDGSVPDVSADLIYTGSIGNKDEALYLFGANCALQDSVSAAPAWVAGDNAEKLTMERKTGFSWQSSRSAGGTPRKENSAGVEAVLKTQDE